MALLPIYSITDTEVETDSQHASNARRLLWVAMGEVLAPLSNPDPTIPVQHAGDTGPGLEHGFRCVHNPLSMPGWLRTILWRVPFTLLLHPERNQRNPPDSWASST